MPPASQLVDLVARILALVPPWVRIYRIQRDIPMPLVTSGVEKGNLRELALARMGHLGLKCRDVRTREAGIQDIHHKARTDAAMGMLPPIDSTSDVFLSPDMWMLMCLICTRLVSYLRHITLSDEPSRTNPVLPQMSRPQGSFCQRR